MHYNLRNIHSLYDIVLFSWIALMRSWTIEERWSCHRSVNVEWMVAVGERLTSRCIVEVDVPVAWD